LWSSWAHDWLFSDQDKWVVEAIGPGKELLSSTDVGVSTWRWFAVRNARRPAQPKVNGAPVEQSSVGAEEATI
jgi:hypothetical protein